MDDELTNEERSALLAAVDDGPWGAIVACDSNATRWLLSAKGLIENRSGALTAKGEKVRRSLIK